MKISNIVLIILIGLLVWYYWPKNKKACCASCAGGDPCKGDIPSGGPDATTNEAKKKGFYYNPITGKWIKAPSVIDEDLTSF